MGSDKNRIGYSRIYLRDRPQDFHFKRLTKIPSKNKNLQETEGTLRLVLYTRAVTLRACRFTVSSRKKRYAIPALLSLLAFCLVILAHSNISSDFSARWGAPSNVASDPFSSPVSSAKKHKTKPLDAALVDIHSVSPDVLLDIRYATRNNFTRQQLYSQPRCLLRAGVARKLAKVQADLAQVGLGLKVFDCYRPLSVQKRMWELVPDDRYVANPNQGSRHNRGAAVDLTLVDSKGNELEMPSKFDDFSNHASVHYKGSSSAAQHNRQLLEKVMRKHGFTSIETEWWHFDAANWQKFEIADLPFESVL